MDFQPYIPGLKPADPGPLSRFLPALEEGVVSAWLSHLNRPFDAAQGKPSAWLLDPFGFSPRLVLEAARSGYRVLVTANNPVARFLLEIFANPPTETEFSAALADLSAIKKGDERLGAHLQSLYLTSCEKCGQQIHAQAFLWRKDEEAPYARIYECKQCGDSGERIATQEDIERAKKIAATDGLHRSRAFEKVTALKDEDRVYTEEAIQHYLPRPLYAITTIVNRLDSMGLAPERKRALTALVLVACDAGNTLWAHPAERPRPKQLTTPNQFREHNVWLQLERGINLFTETGSPVICETWPKKLPESGGICIYEGRLKDLAHEVKKEIPIGAVIGSIPRPNQAFWTLSALWAGWLWGHEAVDPYKVALRRRRYDWAWNATALNAAFDHMNDLLPDNVPFFGLIAEPEPSFLTSVLTAASVSGFALQSIAIRTEHDPVQIIWKSVTKQKTETSSEDVIQTAVREYLIERGEPATYLHVHGAGLAALAEMNALKTPDMEFDEALRKTNGLFETVLKDETKFIHYSTGESLDSGMWRIQPSSPARSAENESLADRVEMAIVSYLQKNQNALYLEIENDLYQRFPGLSTPSKGLIYAVLNSYAERDGGFWKLRAEDVAATRREEYNNIFLLLGSLGTRLGYKVIIEDRLIHWQEAEKLQFTFYVLASALIGKALEAPAPGTIFVIPGGRAALVAIKLHRDPALEAQLKNHRVVKYRLLRTIAELPILTRETFEEQIASDPIEKTTGQMMMF